MEAVVTHPSATTSLVVHLERIIPSLLTRNPPAQDVREFVYFCRNTALGYLRAKIRRGKLDPKYFGVSLQDLALDCVAPLFERNGSGRFIVLSSFYSKENIAILSPTELLGATRRLVFGSVNGELFTLYKANDPSLARVIRNIKDALRFSDKLTATIHRGEWWVLVPSANPAHLEFPILSTEILEARLLSQIRPGDGLRAMLECVATILRDQDFYQKQYPLVGVAIVIRAVMIRSYGQVREEEEFDPWIAPEELREFVRDSIEHIRLDMRRKYVGRGKISNTTFQAYFDSVEDILSAEYTSSDASNLTYYEMLRSHLDTLTLEEYRSKHRPYLEYLVKLTKANLLESIKKELRVT